MPLRVCWRIYHFSRRSSPTPIYFGASYSCNSHSKTFLFLFENTTSLLPLVVMYQKFISLYGITLSKILLMIFNLLASYHFIAFNRFQPITIMSFFAAQLIFDSTFNLYRRFNTNSHSIFNKHHILRLFSTLFIVYINSTLHSSNCLTLQFSGFRSEFVFQNNIIS